MTRYAVIVRDECSEAITTVEIEAERREDARVQALNKAFREKGWRKTSTGILDVEEVEEKRMKGKPTLGRALQVAFEVHAKQVDKLGEPYIGHIVRVVSNVRAAGGSHDEQIIAALHDTLEDGWISTEYLTDEFGEYVASAVDVLSRREAESYEDYVRRVASCPEVVAVKLADVQDNMEPGRLFLLPDKTRERLQRKYDGALTILHRGMSGEESA